MRKPILEIEHADVFIPGKLERTRILKDLNWCLQRHEHAAIIGANGAGKSSLLKLVHGDLWPCAGSICWYDEYGVRETSRIAARNLTAIVSPSAQEELMRGMRPESARHFLQDAFAQARDGNEAQWDLWQGRALMKLLEQSGIQKMWDAEISQFSQGQLRLLMLAKAVLARPLILLLDEFADGLDAEVRRQVNSLLTALKEQITMIFTSHREENLPSWCKSRLYLHQGRQAQRETGEYRPKKSPVFSLGRTGEEALFELESVSVYVERKKILQDLDWRVLKGENWRISGANGSGKSTLLRLLAGDEFVALGGKIRRWHPQTARLLGSLAEVRTHFALVSGLTEVRNEYPLNALELVCSGFDNSTGLHRMPEESEKAQALMLLEQFFPGEDAGKLAQTDIRRLSTGQIRKLYLARAMAARPSVLLLDEPLNGLDRQSRNSYLDLLHELASRGDRDRPTLIMVSHYDSDVPAFVNRHARLKDGHLRLIS